MISDCSCQRSGLKLYFSDGRAARVYNHNIRKKVPSHSRAIHLKGKLVHISTNIKYVTNESPMNESHLHAIGDSSDWDHNSYTT